MSSPWAKIAPPEPVSLDEIMSEEMAKDLQAKEICKFMDTATTEEIPPELLADNTQDSDFLIAQVLQRDYDKEFNENLKRTENKYNGTSKVSISFDNYRTASHCEEDSESEEEELEDLRDRRDWDRFDTNQREFASIPPCGYKLKNGRMVTKHDVTISGRRNACKLLSFPPEFQTGDGAGFDLKLSNKVFNSLKMHSKHEQARLHKVKDKKEDHATAEFGVDEHTGLLLFKLVNNNVLDSINGVISIGKEAVILHADVTPSQKDPELPKESVIKVFKTTLSEFKERDKYIRDDYRFKDRIGKQHTRKIMYLWAEKEMHNLIRLQRAGIPCPTVVELKQHVLVMSFIGKDHMPAPKLKDAIMDHADYIVAYEQVVQGMKDLFSKANLIHADLSEYNILWHNGVCYFIDVSQAVEPCHENAFYFLMRDCKNMTNFFNRKGVDNVMTADGLFEEITGCSYMNRIELQKLRDTLKPKPHRFDVTEGQAGCSFERIWEQTVVDSSNSSESGSLIEEVKG